MAVERPQPHDNILTDLSQLDDRIDVVAHKTIVVFVVVVVFVVAAVHSTAISTGRRRVFEAPSFQELFLLLPTVTILAVLVKDVETERDVHGALPSLQNGSVELSGLLLVVGLFVANLVIVFVGCELLCECMQVQVHSNLEWRHNTNRSKFCELS